MLDLSRLIAALLLPWLFGIAVLSFLSFGQNDTSPKALILGYGYLIGMIFTTFLLRILPLNFTLVAFCLGLSSIIILALRCSQSSRSKPSHPAGQTNKSGQLSNSLLIATGFFFILIVIRLTGLGLESSIRPLFPWDGWAAWAVKARVWFELQDKVLFVEADQWLSNFKPYLYTVEAWHYPDTISLIQTWLALSADEWNDVVINIPWFFCAVALACSFYSQARLAGISALLSMIFTYLLISIPLLDIHTALGGYADIWLAAAYGMTSFATFLFLKYQQKSQLILVILGSLCCVMIKLEGLVLIFTLLPAFIIGFCSTRTLKFAATMLIVLIVGMLAWYLNSETLTLRLPYLGRFSFSYHPVWDAFLTNFYQFDNWHLFWYFFALVALYAVLHIKDYDRSLLAWLSISLFCALYVAVLFGLTQNYLWAENYTSLNRITLHILPMLVFTIAILFNRATTVVSMNVASTIPAISSKKKL